MPRDPNYYRKQRAESPYFKSEKFKKSRRLRASRYGKKNRLQRNARRRVQWAVETGKIVRPDHCTKCGLVCKPEAHHPDHRKMLEVVWVCKECHIIEDGKP
jgi:hypothetical protein